MIRLIRFSDMGRWKRTGKWTLVYGRRKTGKTFFIKNFLHWDRYFFVGRSGEVFDNDERISYDVFLREITNSLKNGRKIVVDEIQRLPEEFFDRLHSLGITGRLIAISSTLWLARKLIGERSPLLGLFSEFEMGLMDERDIVRNLSSHIRDRKKLVEFSVYLREPWLVPLWESTQENFIDSIPSNIRITVPALIGEIFSEERRELTSIYEGVLKSVADGKRISGEIANSLFALHLIPTQNPSLIHPYLKILKEIGILEKVKIWGKNRYQYYLSSPVMDLFFYLDAKYGITERGVSEEQMKEVMRRKLPLHVEQFFGDLLSKVFGLWKERIVEKDYEVDIALTDFRKLKVVSEVKWKELREAELKRIENVLNRFDCKRILIVPRRDAVRDLEGIEVWDINTILNKISS